MRVTPQLSRPFLALAHQPMLAPPRVRLILIEYGSTEYIAASYARGQLNRENISIPVPVRAREIGLARWVRPSHPASAASFSTLRLNVVLTHGIPPAFRDGVHINYKLSTAIGTVPSLSGHAIAYRWRSVRRVRRHRASSPQDSSSERCCLFRLITMDHFFV